MRQHLTCIFAGALLAAFASGQRQPGPRPDPVTLVSRAETLLNKGEKEDAVLLLWQALVELRDRPADMVHDATRLSASYLLTEQDPLAAERRRAFSSVADKQVAVAKSYRLKKWYDTAAGRLDVAAQYDPDAVTAERTRLAALQSRTKPTAAAEVPKPRPGQPSLLRQDATRFTAGAWQETDDALSVPAYTLPNNLLWEWVCKRTHEDHEIVVEVRPADAKAEWNAAIGVGLEVLPGTNSFSGYRCFCQYHPKTRQMSLFVWRIKGQQVTMILDKGLEIEKAQHDFHRLGVQVVGDQLFVTLDGHPTASAKGDGPIRGHVGLLAGLTTSPSCGVAFRNLRVDELPASRPTDEELRQESTEKRQHAVTSAVDEARKLIADKQPESAAARLRDALLGLRDLPTGILRSNLEQSVTQMLQSTDAIAKKRHQAAVDCAAALGQLADKYALDGRPRLARVLVLDALRFDPSGQQQRLEAIEQAITDWNIAQTKARAAELLPPNDERALLREWFAQGQLLDSRSQRWAFDQSTARAVLLDPDYFTAQVPKAGAPALTKAKVHMRLPAVGTSAGFCFDVASQNDFAIATLQRESTGMLLMVFRKTTTGWNMLGKRRADLDTWRLDGWHELSIEVTAAGVAVGGAGLVLTIARPQLGLASPRFGICASNGATTAQTIELIALQLGDQ